MSKPQLKPAGAEIRYAVQDGDVVIGAVTIALNPSTLPLITAVNGIDIRLFELGMQEGLAADAFFFPHKHPAQLVD